MRRRKVNDEQLTWLYNHYNDDGMTAKDLAEKLTEMVSKSAKKDIQRLKGLLPSIDNPVIYQQILKEIQFIQDNMVITVGDVRRYKIRYNMPYKSANHISMQNRKKAAKTNLKKWRNKAIEVESILEFLQSVDSEESIIVKPKSFSQMESFKTMISRWNSSTGYRKEIFFNACYDRTNMLIRIQPRRNRG